MFIVRWKPISGCFALGVLLAAAGLPARAFAQAIDQNLWVANGQVYAVARSGNTLYIGGGFTQVGPSTGAAVPIDAVTGAPAQGFPKVAGVVLVVTPDGSGGWFIGGLFGAVGGIPRANLAHILANYNVAPWNPGANDAVYSMVVSGGLVYVGGGFTNVGGQPRNAIAALDLSTGLATTWDPNVTGGPGFEPTTVYAMVVSGSTVYLGGNFRTVSGQTRNYIAAVDVGSGVPTAWNPNAGNWPNFPGPSVRAMAMSGTTIYVGGFFTTIGGQSRNHIAALDATSGLASTWNPNSEPGVYGLAVSGGTVYVGGDFTKIGGSNRMHAAALSASTGAATSWNPNAGGLVLSFAVGTSTVYVGGEFASIGGQPRNGIAELSTTSGLATSWNPNVNNVVWSVVMSGSTVFAGGSFSGVGGQSRKRLAALDATTGQLTPWNPTANGIVNALVVNQGIVFVGGFFDTIGAQPRIHIAALDGATGAPTTWNANSNGFVDAMAIEGGPLYVGGRFTSIGGQPRNHLAALDIETGLATAWNPNADSQVSALATAGSTIYAGGAFSNIGGQPRTRIAALDSATGDATAWNPGTSPEGVSALAVSGGIVYAAGGFTAIGGQARNRIAAVDAATGLVSAWNPNANNTVRALAVSGATVYAGGDFTTIGGQPRSKVAALVGTSGLAAPWNPGANDNVYSLAASGATVYAAGVFTRMGLEAQSGIAAIAASPALTSVAPSSAYNTAPVMIMVSGSGLPPGAAVKLSRSGEADIPGTNVIVAVDATSLTATFDITGADVGTWDVVVVTPDLQIAALPGGFLVALGAGVGDPPLTFMLETISPNPSAGRVSLAYSLPKAARVKLGIYDPAGRLLSAIVDGERPAGRHAATWNARDRGAQAGPGVYFARYETPVGTWVRRFALIR